MGMPISSYSFLSAIAGTHEEKGWWQERVKAFRLFAFILHDPNRHRLFHGELSRSFDTLDYATGQRFLFLALVDPPKEGFSHFSRGGRFAGFPDTEVGSSLRDPDNALQSNNPSMTAFSLAETLGIPYTHLPCIVVTRSFENKVFHYFTVSPEGLKDRLFHLGYLAERVIPDTREPDAFWRMEGHGDIHKVRLRKSLASALAEPLSFIAGGGGTRGRDNPVEREIANRKIGRVVEGYYKKLSGMKDGDVQVEETRLSFARNVALFADQTELQEERGGELDLTQLRTVFEPESFQQVGVGNACAKAIESGKFRDIYPGELKNAMDYGPPVLYFAKAFENEVNLSMVHWARKVKGVRLPEFFNRIQPGLSTATVQANPRDPRTIDLNNGKRGGGWRPLELGTALVACETILASHSPPHIHGDDADFLFRRWRDIRNIRNSSSHDPGFLPYRSFSVVEGAFEQLMKKGVFFRLHQMKEEFRGNGIGQSW
jgi:hypothetical protein